MLEAVLDHATDDLAANIADLALQIPDAGFAGIAADDRGQAVVGEDDVLVAEAGGLALLLDEILLGDFEFLDLGIAMQPENLHAVLQRAGNGVEHVCRSDEEDLRQVVFHVEIVVLEAGVLLRVEDLEQRRSRVAAEIPA